MYIYLFGCEIPCSCHKMEADGDKSHPSAKDDASVFRNLCTWIEAAGGHVNHSIELRTKAPNGEPISGFNGDQMRGVFAKKSIVKGDVLIRLPSDLAISGEKLPRKWGKDNRVASPWLRCLACLYLAQDDPKWEAYVASLPAEFETLWQWRDEEVRFLDGTTLGETLKNDREETAWKLRYEESVRPFLKYLKVPETSNKYTEALSLFQRVSMCISTRVFHMQPPEEENETEKTEPGDPDLEKKPAAKPTGEPKSKTSYSSGVYVGPFLLPMIDLLNHAVEGKATTLQRDKATKAFYMVAERDISAGEEVCHSYGDKLTAAQLLQTFGFIPESKIRGSISEDLWGNVRNKTPAVLSKEELVEACRAVAKSDYPKELKETMKEHDIGGETWELKIYSEEERDLECLPDQYLITASTSSSCLTDEIVTLCCIHLLPDYVFNEIFGDEPRLLDQGVLEDYFLGKLVVMAILTAIKNRLAAYPPLENVPGVEDEETIDDKAILQALLRLDKHNPSTLRAMYGVTIRLEEKKGLEELRNEVVAVISCLDDEEADEDDDTTEDVASRPAKKQKIEME